MKPKTLKDLNRKMFSLVSSFPKTRGELIDFHYKSYFDEYLDAIKVFSGRKMLIFGDTVDDTRSIIRRLMLISDSIIFNVNTYSRSPKISIFPIPDDVRSPVLGLMRLIVPASAAPNTTLDHFRSPERAADTIRDTIRYFDSHAMEYKTPDSFFGHEWNQPDSYWERTAFTRTGDAYKNEKHQKCHMAVGIAHEYDQSTYDWILGEARPLLLDGYLAFAPFIRSTAGPESLGERLHKARLIFSRLMIQDDKLILPLDKIHPLALLDIPYLENVPLELLAKALKNEGESLRAFRRIVDRSIEDVTNLEDFSEIKKEFTRIKRDLIEDELDRVRKLCQRLSRMKSFMAVSAVVTTAAITAVGAMHIGLPELILAGSTGVTANLTELVQIYEQQKEIKSSPMYFLWKLGHLKRT